MTESVLADTWLYDTLSADVVLTATAPGGVWADTAPVGTTEPFVTFTKVAGRDHKAIGSIRVWEDCLYDVKATKADTKYTDLDAAADRIDAVLHDVAATVTGGRIVQCTRESGLRLSEVTDGVSYRHLGGTYRLQVREE